MKIAIDYRMADSSGIGTYITESLPYIIEMAEKNSDSITLLGTAAQLQPFSKNKNVTCIKCSVSPFSVKELFLFPANISHVINSCDVYYTPYCNIPSGIKIPVFTTIHDVVFLDVPGLASPVGTFIRKLFYLYAVRRSTMLFTVSQFSKERIQKTLHCTKPIIVTYNGVASYLRKPFIATPQKTDTIIYIGNIKRHKGLSSLLDAFELLRKNGSINGKFPKLVIVGNADNFRAGDTAILEKIRIAEENGTVEFTGKINGKELKLRLAQAKLLVQPSLYEGFGIPPLEALSLGTAVTLSDIPVFKEIYGNLPVTFFKAGDAQDMAQKLASCYYKDCYSGISTAFASAIPDRYSYRNSAAVVYRTIEETLISKGKGI